MRDLALFLLTMAAAVAVLATIDPGASARREPPERAAPAFPDAAR
jgi:hypothetical protein